MACEPPVETARAQDKQHVHDLILQMTLLFVLFNRRAWGLYHAPGVESGSMGEGQFIGLDLGLLTARVQGAWGLMEKGSLSLFGGKGFLAQGHTQRKTHGTEAVTSTQGSLLGQMAEASWKWGPRQEGSLYP